MESSKKEIINEKSGVDSNGSNSNKIMAVIGYIVPILFFVPLLSDAKNDPYAKFHANQQLNLLLFWVLGRLTAGLLLIVLIGFLLMPMVMVAGVVFMILGVINASNGSMKPLPLIGKWQFIK